MCYRPWGHSHIRVEAHEHTHTGLHPCRHRNAIHTCMHADTIYQCTHRHVHAHAQYLFFSLFSKDALLLVFMAGAVTQTDKDRLTRGEDRQF